MDECKEVIQTFTEFLDDFITLGFVSTIIRTGTLNVLSEFQHVKIKGEGKTVCRDYGRSVFSIPDKSNNCLLRISPSFVWQSAQDGTPQGYLIGMFQLISDGDAAGDSGNAKRKR